VRWPIRSGGRGEILQFSRLQILYTKMENEIKWERQQILEKERIKETRIKNDLGTRDQQLVELHIRPEALEHALKQLQKNKSTANDELVQLSKEKRLKELRRQNMKDRRQRVAAVSKVNDYVAIEREGLVEQLNLLRSINLRLSDERDFAAYGTNSGSDATDVATSLIQELGNAELHSEPLSIKKGGSGTSGSIGQLSELINVDFTEPEIVGSTTPPSNELISSDSLSSSGRKIEEKMVNGSQVPKLFQLAIEKVKGERNKVDSAPRADNRIEPPGRHDNIAAHQTSFRFRQEQSGPSSVFKIIVIGDAGVGKTAFIRRICHDDFNTTSGSTLGIDMQTRCFPFGNGRQMCLQFWDTAGQEKYRSLTRQYLRKADGLVVIYDICSETSFHNARHWINTVRESTDEETVCVLIGNKSDLAENVPAMRKVSAASGERLAHELLEGGLFFETSAQSGYLVERSIVAMAAKLQIRQRLFQETNKEVVLKSTNGRNKRTCCSS